MAKLFSDREIRAIAVFLPLAGLLIIALMLVRPAADPEAARRAEAEMEEALPADSVVMSHFDPNTASLDDLRRLGLTKHEAVSLLKYRAAGKVFRIPEDLTLCYGISDSLYRRLEPWVRIGRKYAIAPEKYRTGRILPEPLAPGPFRIDTVSARYLRAIGALSKRQAEAFIRWRDLSGIYDMEDLRECYVVSDSVAAALEPYVIFPERKARPIEQPVELNTADSATLRSVVGIGPRTVVAIMHYRERLGGFVRAEQLAEVPGVRERNYEKILKQIYCDSCKIRKIDINFASPKVLGKHPYIAPQALRKLLKAEHIDPRGGSTAGSLSAIRVGQRTCRRIKRAFLGKMHRGCAPRSFQNEQTDSKQQKTKNIMIIMPVKEGENIERALKKFKRKYERTGVLKELRRRQYFTKPSIAKREAMQHAIYVEHMYRDDE